MELQGKVAIVTGGASGLGRATVETLVARGAKAVIFDMNADLAKSVAEELGANVSYAVVNVADEDSVKAGIAHTIEKFGAIHVCVNCAGIGPAAKTLGKEGPLELKKFNLIINVNLIGTFNVLRLAAAEMAKNEPLNADNERGVIVNTASVAAFDGQVGQVAYSASKGGIVGMTLPIARDLSSYGIRINTICPGIMNTPLMNAAPDKVKQPLIEMTQFPKRLGHPAEFGALVAHLCENTFFNGETLRLDGGIRMAPR